MLSHDDDSPEMRKAFRAQGVTIAEFPVNEATAREAAAAGDFYTARQMLCAVAVTPAGPGLPT
jgi:hypothetical protein